MSTTLSARRRGLAAAGAARCLAPLLAVTALMLGCAPDDGALGARSAAVEDTRCFIAYVHGRGADRTPSAVGPGPSREYWRSSPGDPNGDFVHGSSRAYSPDRACETRVVGYDGGAAFWDAAAAGRVTQQVNAWIVERQIPAGRLILVGHSMGGLVVRWILNNGVPGAMYFNHRGEDYARVVAATRYAITVSAPHLGSPAADALYGHGGTLCGNVVGGAESLFGEDDRASEYLRRINLEYASASGGWFGDGGRDRTMYTVATRRWNTGTGTLADRGLAAAWWCLGLSDCWVNCRETPGDGLVTEASGAGRFERAGSTDGASWQAGQTVQGRRVDWLRTDHNHNHSRFDDQRLAVTDLREGTAGTGFPGSYIGAHGLDLE